MPVITVQVSRCTSVDFEVSSCDVKDLRDFIAFNCSIVVYMFTDVNDEMEFQTNIDDFVVNQHALAYNFDTREQTVRRLRSWL